MRKFLGSAIHCNFQVYWKEGKFIIICFLQGLEESVGRHQSTVNAMNLAGQEIISKSTTVEADMLRDKLATQNRRWDFICSQVTERRDRYTISSRGNSFSSPKAVNRLKMIRARNNFRLSCPESLDTMAGQIHLSSVTYCFWPVKLYKINSS